VGKKAAGARGYGRAEDKGLSAREEGEGEYGGFEFPSVLTKAKLLRLPLAKHL
jgi:hypothetical protein